MTAAEQTRKLGDSLQPPPQKPQVNLNGIADQIGHLTITAAVLEQQGETLKSEAAQRAAAAHLNLALVMLDLEPTEK
jgi:hypothetical protein